MQERNYSSVSKQATQLDPGGQGPEEDEHAGKSKPGASSQSALGEEIKITFKIFEQEDWREVDTLFVGPSEIDQDGRCSVIERLVNKYGRKGFVLYNKDIEPSDCFQVAREDGTNTVHLVQKEATTDRQSVFVSNRSKPAEPVAKKARTQKD
ncbi:hypothetical protein RJ035_003509 [Blastomyces gilchristii]